MAQLHDRSVGLESSSQSFERPMADGLEHAHSGGVAHAPPTLLHREPLGLRHRAAAKLHQLHEAAERGDDLGAMAVVVATVAVFVLSIAAILTAIALSLYFTMG
jgi:hypothetical protein